MMKAASERQGFVSYETNAPSGHGGQETKPTFKIYHTTAERHLALVVFHIQTNCRKRCCVRKFPWASGAVFNQIENSELPRHPLPYE